MGARRFMFTRNRERELVPEGVKLDYIGRQYRASPGEGYPAAHRIEQDRIVREALTSSPAPGRRTGELHGDRPLTVPLDRCSRPASSPPGPGPAGEHRVERAAQPGGVLGRVAVVAIRRAAVAQHAVGVDHEHVGRGLRAVGARDLLRCVVQVGQRPAAVLAHALCIAS